MSIFAISDLHLCLSENKPMDVFGVAWENYIERLKKNWDNKISEEDTVLIPGDISWATYINNAYKDFEFINKLKGKKILLKGNHDYWWETKSKLDRFLKFNSFNTISILHNNSYNIEGLNICGTRGWILEDNKDFKLAQDKKILNREIERLKISLNSAKTDKDTLVMLHYPPFTNVNFENSFMDLMYEYKVKYCLYGHLHSFNSDFEYDFKNRNITFKLVSADYLKFNPVKLR